VERISKRVIQRERRNYKNRSAKRRNSVNAAHLRFIHRPPLSPLKDFDFCFCAAGIHGLTKSGQVASGPSPVDIYSSQRSGPLAGLVVCPAH